MWAQHQILTTLRGAEPDLQEVLEEHRDKSRTAVCRIVAERFQFLDARSRPQSSGCLKALRTLESEGIVVLPASQRSERIAGPSLLPTPVEAPKDVPDTVNKVEGLKVTLVTDRRGTKIWNTLIDKEHPRGTTTFAGAQLRYLFESAHGLLGGIGFSAAALYLKPRDTWMAWSKEQQGRDLFRVVGLSRFLIRPQVQCSNLASHLLGQVLRRLPQDFRARYGYAPYLVETFVGPDQEGTCFKAAGFLSLGLTLGMGRHALSHKCTRSKKKIFVKELDKDWRKKLGVPHVELYPRLEVGQGLDGDRWAEQEFGDAPLGDKRRTNRLVKSVSMLSEAMGKPPGAAPKLDRAAVSGYYRFLEKAEKFKITPDKILATHRECTIARMRTQDTVLCVQDGTDISFSTRPECEGLEVIGSNQTTAEAKGVHLHATLVVGADGVPLGVLRCAYSKPEAGTHTANTQLWIDGLDDIDKAAQTLPRKTRVLSVMDREADIFALFAKQRTLKRTDVLVRAKHNRWLVKRDKKDESRLFKAMRKGPAAGTMELSVTRVSRRAKAGRILNDGRPARHALMEVRYRKVTLPPTEDATQEPVKLWGVHIREMKPPEGVKRVEWYLLTTCAVTSLEEAEAIIKFYGLRWRVEDTFRVLKSGCKVEKLRMQKASLLHNAITIHIVTAWRLLLMTLLCRISPDLEAEVIFTDMELEALHEYADYYSLKKPTNLMSAVLLIGIMGGYAPRKHSHPGHTVLWRGYSSLQIQAALLGRLIASGRMSPRAPP